MKLLKPGPHSAVDYAWSVKMISAPWVVGFSENKRATQCSVMSGLAIAGLSLLTRYPGGVVKAIPFPIHGAIEAASGVATIAAPWLYGFADNRRAKWTHVLSGLLTLGVVAVTDYEATEPEYHQSPRQVNARPRYQVSAAAEYDKYTAQPPYTHYGDPREQEERVM